MDKTTIIVIAGVLVILIVAGLLLAKRRRSERLQSQFGPEYERSVREMGDKAKAEAELQDRQKRVEKLDIRPLDRAQRQRFTTEWEEVQADFVDDPEQSIRGADILLQDVMTARGYPVKNFEQVAADISVGHPTVVQHFRTAHEIAVQHERGHADTEDLRKAMINYRELFDELVSEGGEADRQSQLQRTDNDAGTRART